MFNTKLFRTRHEFFKKSSPKGKDYIIGLDAGYSGMKVWYENGYFCFPSYAKKLGSNTLNIFSEKDILYKDNLTDEIYMLGYTAQEMIGSVDTNDTEGELYGRKRYSNPKFQILCNAAIGIALMNKKDDRQIFVETGLPASYVNGDTGSLKKALCKPVNFSLKLGNRPWISIKLNLDSDHVHVIPQPAGSLYSVLIRNDGAYIPDAKKILFGNTLVGDFGSGTCDFYGIKSRAVACSESSDDFGSKEILKKTSSMILNNYGEDIRPQALQHNLETGFVTCVDEETMQQEEKPIADFVEKANRETFTYAMERCKSITNAFRDYQNFIVTGGTGEAWYEEIKKYLAGMKSLQIIPGNINDPEISFLYANVRGYYLYRFTLNRKK